MERMTSRERVLAALNHHEPDRIPIDLGGTTASGIHIDAYQSLCQYLEIEVGELQFISERARLAYPSEQILQVYGVDTRAIVPATTAENLEWNEDGTTTDIWGVVRRRPESGHYYVVKEPLSGEISIQDIANFEWPDPADPYFVDGLEETARKLRHETDAALILNPEVGFLHQSQFMRGFEEMLVDLVGAPRMIAYLFDVLIEIWLEIVERMMRAVGDNVDIVFFADDLAMQENLLFSPDIYRKMIKPRQARIFDGIRRMKEGIKILFHSDGALHSILGDLVDLGIDAINPVQVSARGMGDTARLKREFGKELAFWGAIDTQNVLPMGDPEDVRAEVMRRISDLSQDGGYVLASVHDIQPDFPPENVDTMLKFAREYKNENRDRAGF